MPGLSHTHTPCLVHEERDREHPSWTNLKIIRGSQLWHLPGLANALALMWQWYLAQSRTPNLQRCRWGGGVLIACTRQTSVELEHLPSWPSHVQPTCTIHSPPVAESSSSYANNNPNTWVKNAKIQITETPITLPLNKLPPQKHTVTLALYDSPSKNWHIITAYLFLYRHSTQILQPFKYFVQI